MTTTAEAVQTLFALNPPALAALIEHAKGWRSEDQSHGFGSVYKFPDGSEIEVHTVILVRPSDEVGLTAGRMESWTRRRYGA